MSATETTTSPSPTPLSDALQANGYWNPNWDPIAEIDKIVAYLAKNFGKN